MLDGHLVEVKRATKNTLNQVRTVKYLPIAVCFESIGGADSWYVIPAHVVVARVARKHRGQHTENPFESATLNLADFAAFKITDPVANLRQATLAAITESDRYQELRDEMATILTEARRLSMESRERVEAILQRLGIK